MAWIRSIRQAERRVRAAWSRRPPGRPSATLFQETGTTATRMKTRRPVGPSVQFKRQRAVPPHGRDLRARRGHPRTASSRSRSSSASRSSTRRPDSPCPSSRSGQPNAWKKYRHLLVTGIERWKKVRTSSRTRATTRKPILFILCRRQERGARGRELLTYGEASRDDLAGEPVKG